MCIFGRMAFQPVKILHLGFSAGDDQICGFGKACDGQVSLNPAFFIEPLGIDQLARGNIDIVGTDAVEHGHGVAAFKTEFGET